MSRKITRWVCGVAVGVMLTGGVSHAADGPDAPASAPPPPPAAAEPQPAAAAPDSPPKPSPVEQETGRALLDVLTPPPAPPEKPAANAEADINRPDPQQAAIVARIRKALVAPPPALDPAFVRHRLDVLVQDCETLERIAPPGVLKFQALSLQLQSLYARIQRWPDEPDTDHRLARLRAAARRLKALEKSDASAIGDFWLTTASLWEINHSELPLDQRRQQVRQLLQEYLDRYSAGAPADAVVTALNQLGAAPPPRQPEPEHRP